MALCGGQGREGSVKVAAGAASAVGVSGEPLQVPPASARTPPEAGALDKRRNLGDFLTAPRAFRSDFSDATNTDGNLPKKSRRLVAKGSLLFH
jgi:hypothetical protein